MAVDIRNIANRNGIYYFRCRIPSNLTNGQYREVKISLNTNVKFDVIPYYIWGNSPEDTTPLFRRIFGYH